MNLSRRGFLGSVIGTLAVSQLPFVAEAVAPFTAPATLENFRISAFGRKWRYPDDPLAVMEEFWSPKLTPVLDENTITWKCEDIVLNQKLEVAGLKVYAPNGQLIAKNYFSGGWVYGKPGSILKMNYTLRFDGIHEGLNKNNWQSWIDIASKNLVRMV